MSVKEHPVIVNDYDNGITRYDGGSFNFALYCCLTNPGFIDTNIILTRCIKIHS